MNVSINKNTFTSMKVAATTLGIVSASDGVVISPDTLGRMLSAKNVSQVWVTHRGAARLVTIIGKWAYYGDHGHYFCAAVEDICAATPHWFTPHYTKGKTTGADNAYFKHMLACVTSGEYRVQVLDWKAVATAFEKHVRLSQ